MDVRCSGVGVVVVSLIWKKKKNSANAVRAQTLTAMTDIIKVQGIRYDTTYWVGKYQGYRGKVVVNSNGRHCEVTGMISPVMLESVKESVGEEYDDFQVWLKIDQERVNPYVNILWLH